MIDLRLNNKWTVYIHIFPKEITRHNYDKYYVGITSQKIKSRWGKNGRFYKPKGKKNTSKMWNAIQKYGWDNIKHEIIAEYLTKEEAKQFEITLIALLKSNNEYGYNITAGGDTGNPNIFKKNKSI